MTSHVGPSLPRGWTTPPVYARYSVQLGKMLDEKRIAGTHLAPYLRNVDVQWNHINTNDLPEMDFSAEDRERFSLRSGDLLVCEGGEVGRTALWDGRLSECYFQKAIHRLRPITESDEPRFFRYFMQFAVHSGLFALSTASTIQHLPAEKLRVVRYPSPPRSQQRAIADYLDRETARLDALVAAKERVLKLLAEKRRALLTRAVARGLAPHVPLRDSGIPWLGEIPAHWSSTRLRFLGRFKGGAGFPHGEQGLRNEDLPFFKVKDLSQSDQSSVLTDTDNSISYPTAEQLGAFVFPAGTIVFAKVGAALLLSRFRVLGSPGCIDNNMMGFMVNEALCDRDYALTVMRLFNFAEVVNPGAVPSLNEEQIGDQLVALPPLREQRDICARLTTATSQLDAVSSCTERTISLLKERRSALIAAAVTGQIDADSTA